MAWQQYKVPIVLGSVSIALIALSTVLLVKTTQTPTPIRFIDAPPRPTLTPEEFRVAGMSRVSVNRAAVEDLEALSGIGPVTARKIIDNRPYGSLEELVSKKAMGKSLLNKLKEQLTL